MLTEYCADCGSKNEYTSVKPKFCGSCGEPFDKAFAKVVIRKPKATVVEKEEEEFQEEDNAFIEIDTASIRVTDIPKKQTIEEINKSANKVSREHKDPSQDVVDLLKKLKK